MGGHGYIADEGMEQYVRDCRVCPFMEGTNGIQALDLVMHVSCCVKRAWLCSFMQQIGQDIKRMPITRIKGPV